MSALQIFLVVAAGVFVGLAMFVAAIFLWLRRKLRQLGASFAELAQIQQQLPPSRMKLEPIADPQWLDPGAVQAETNALRSAGFEEAGTYISEGVEGLTLRGLAHPAERLYAVVYDHPQLGVFTDLMAADTDGGSLTYTSAQDPGLDPHPQMPIKYLPHTDAQELHRRLREERPAAASLQPAEPEHFAFAFETHYARIMDWRAGRGGLSDDEVRRIAAREQLEINDDMVEQIKAMFLNALNDGLDDELRERFLQTSNYSAAEWERVRERVRFVHDRMSVEDVLCQLDDALDGHDDDDIGQRVRQAVRNTSPRHAFAQFALEGPPSGRYEKIAAVDQPVEADVYLAPEPDESDEA